MVHCRRGREQQHSWRTLVAKCQKEMGAAHDNTVFVDINCKPMRTLAFVMTLPSRKYNCKLPMNLLNYA